jgi:hypothetical protein
VPCPAPLSRQSPGFSPCTVFAPPATARSGWSPMPVSMIPTVTAPHGERGEAVEVAQHVGRAQVDRPQRDFHLRLHRHRFFPSAPQNPSAGRRRGARPSAPSPQASAPLPAGVRPSSAPRSPRSR